MDTIYLDNNATTAMCDKSILALEAVYRDGIKNPASQHHAGRHSRRLLESYRESVGLGVTAHLTDIHADRVIFTSGGTEANNLAIQGICGSHETPGRIVISGIEHPSVSSAAKFLALGGWDLQTAKTLPNGQVDLEHLASLVNADTHLVCVMLANNETGVIQPVEDVVSLCARHECMVHTDAVQALGKMVLDFRGLGVATMSISAHKIHGPPGVGALVSRHESTFLPLFYGGFQQEGARPGTEAVALAAGFSEALDFYLDKQQKHFAYLSRLQELLEDGILGCCPGAVVVGQGSPRLPQTSCIAFPGIDRQAAVMALDVAGVCCSTGSACASGSSEASPTLLAMGLAPELVEGALRFSVSILNTEEEVRRAVAIVGEVIACFE
ncbi:MAG: cysteine desulfurase family protein [Planctomycetota bacterium]|nr:cysteine desulfurase family protein [Planctomycetota bacterium]